MAPFQRTLPMNQSTEIKLVIKITTNKCILQKLLEGRGDQYIREYNLHLNMPLGRKILGRKNILLKNSLV